MIRIPKGTWKVVGARLDTLFYTISKKKKQKGKAGPGRGRERKESSEKKKNLGNKNHLKYDQIWNLIVRSSQPSFKTLARNNVESPRGRIYGPVSQIPHRP